MIKNVSLSVRLTCWFSSIFLTGFILFGFAMRMDLSGAMSRGRDRTLATRSQRVVTLLSTFSSYPTGTREKEFDDLARATPEGNLLQVFNSKGDLLYPADSRHTMPVAWPKLKPGQPKLAAELSMLGRPYRALVQTMTIGSEPLTICVAGKLDDDRHLLEHFSDGLFWTIPMLLLVSALSGYFVSRRALNPVGRLIASAQSISIGNLSGRLPVPETGDELTSLAKTCNEMLSRLEQAVGQITRFTADASHELRSPLTFIRTVAECALRIPNLDTETAESFRDIVNESALASRLLDDMLTLARSDAGHVNVTFHLVNIAEIVRDVVARCQSFANGKNHALSAQIEDENLCVTGDATTLRRLIWILVDNAIKYTPPGGAVNVSLNGPAPETVITVTDTGLGIPPAALPHVFDRFFRVDPARSDQDGTGLGLAIGKWIADAHFAQLTVDSKVNVGSTFRVAFPPVTTPHSLQDREFSLQQLDF